MNEKARELASRLIRNFNDAPVERTVREPLYDSTGTRLAPGTRAYGAAGEAADQKPGGDQNNGR